MLNIPSFWSVLLKTDSGRETIFPLSLYRDTHGHAYLAWYFYCAFQNDVK